MTEDELPNYVNLTWLCCDEQMQVQLFHGVERVASVNYEALDRQIELAEERKQWVLWDVLDCARTELETRRSSK